MPPVSQWILLLPAFSGLLLLLERTDAPRRAFAIGWGFALGYFATGLYWIANALLIDVATFWWMVPFAVLGLPAFLAVFVGASTALWRWLEPGPILGLPLFATTWSLAELARGHLLTGFPWNLIGYAWWERPEPLQGMALIGVYGLGFVTILASAAPVLLLGRGMRGKLAACCAMLPLLALGAWGHQRLAEAPSEMVPGVRLRLVQPNIAQTIKLAAEDRITSFERLLALSASPAAQPPTVILWPETAVPFLLERELNARAALAELLSPGATAIVGAPRVTVAPDGKARFFNGMVAIDADDLVRGVYDKHHLVPFGEYVPLRGLLPIETVANRDTDYAAGDGPRTLRVPGAPAFGPLICYEGIFPGAAIDEADRPDWMLNLTNDAWYGNSSGPYQHFVIVAGRAIEEGLPMVRVANSGVSGVIDPYGRVTSTLDLGRQGVLDAELPVKHPNATLYTMWRSYPLFASDVLFIFWAIMSKRRRI